MVNFQLLATPHSIFFVTLGFMSRYLPLYLDALCNDIICITIVYLESKWHVSVLCTMDKTYQHIENQSSPHQEDNHTHNCQSYLCTHQYNHRCIYSPHIR